MNPVTRSLALSSVLLFACGGAADQPPVEAPPPEPAPQEQAESPTPEPAAAEAGAEAEVAVADAEPGVDAPAEDAAGEDAPVTGVVPGADGAEPNLAHPELPAAEGEEVMRPPEGVAPDANMPPEGQEEEREEHVETRTFVVRIQEIFQEVEDPDVFLNKLVDDPEQLSGLYADCAPGDWAKLEQGSLPASVIAKLKEKAPVGCAP